MRPETPAHLWDALEAAKKTQAIIDGLRLDDYVVDWIRQSAVERQLEIVGEALGRIRRDDLATAERIPDIHSVIATRNVIIHRYDDVDHVRVWAMLHQDIPVLIRVLQSLLDEFGPPAR